MCVEVNGNCICILRVKTILTPVDLSLRKALSPSIGVCFGSAPLFHLMPKRISDIPLRVRSRRAGARQPTRYARAPHGAFDLIPRPIFATLSAQRAWADFATGIPCRPPSGSHVPPVPGPVPTRRLPGLDPTSHRIMPHPATRSEIVVQLVDKTHQAGRESEAGGRCFALMVKDLRRGLVPIQE